jgi:hybrid cluster-associated redox disulfide protein
MNYLEVWSMEEPFKPELTPQTRVAEALAQRPQAAMVFIRRRMACVGCDLNIFETLAGVAQSYGVPVQELIEEIRRF